jgi:endonuclease-3
MFPIPQCELFYLTPYQLLVSVILSAQTTDKMVNRCMESHYRLGLNLEQVLAMGEQRFLRIIKPIGLAPTKAKHILAMSLVLRQDHGGQVPDQRSELENLAGVGRKTASVVLGEIFKQATLAVDTHVMRVGRRLGLHDAPTPLKAEVQMLELIPRGRLPKAHHQLIHLGRSYCKAIKPKCTECPLAQLCPYFKAQSRSPEAGAPKFS